MTPFPDVSSQDFNHYARHRFVLKTALLIITAAVLLWLLLARA